MVFFKQYFTVLNLLRQGGAFTFFVFHFFPAFCSGSNATADTSGLSKQYSIMGAQLANKSYTFSKLGYFVNDPKLVQRNIDSAIYYIEQSITSIDSAIFFACDSDLLALDYARIAKNFASKAYKTLRASLSNSDFHARKELSMQAALLSANTVTDAYHSSFYFLNNCNPNQPKPVKENVLAEKKADVSPPPKVDAVAPHITKLDVDQSLFSLLKEHLNEKKSANLREIAKLSEQLKTEKDTVKAAKIREQIKRLQQENAEIDAKIATANSKLQKINTLIGERKKNGGNYRDEETVFSKSMRAPIDKWNKPFLDDVDLPAGLVYQVQVGVYRKMIAPEVFRGLTPVFRITSSKGASYSTGLFQQYADAKQAKEYVQSFGLTDAFIVAYYNQKKIPLVEAEKFEKK